MIQRYYLGFLKENKVFLKNNMHKFVFRILFPQQFKLILQNP